ncbi:hypothetical protein ACFY2K_10815 [Kitasatospora sp. NPDC001309]|uniref:hypothetical protein n=1 Tax=Kitasatospora sp. NPDC001309 TaxID=3364013 RepID=UPI0036BCE2DF
MATVPQIFEWDRSFGACDECDLPADYHRWPQRDRSWCPPCAAEAAADGAGLTLIPEVPGTPVEFEEVLLEWDDRFGDCIACHRAPAAYRDRHDTSALLCPCCAAESAMGSTEIERIPVA